MPIPQTPGSDITAVLSRKGTFWQQYIVVLSLLLAATLYASFNATNIFFYSIFLVAIIVSVTGTLLAWKKKWHYLMVANGTCVALIVLSAYVKSNIP